MTGQNRRASDSDETGPSRDLPEAFTKDPGQEGQPLKEVYDSGGASREKRTSTGLNVADEGSAESFPASDPPSPMASASALDGPADKSS